MGKGDGRRRTRLILLVVVVAGIVVASTLVLSLPPTLSLSTGSAKGIMMGDFQNATSTVNPVFANVSAITYANQSVGPASTLTIVVTSHAFYDSAAEAVMIFVDVGIVGRIAANVHPSSLAVTYNQTGPLIAVFSSYGLSSNANASFDPNPPVAFFDNGSGTLTSTLTNQGGSTGFHRFAYYVEFQITERYWWNHFVGLRAALGGWFLPTITVFALLEIIDLPAGQWA